MSYREKVDELYPNSLPEAEFVNQTYDALQAFGFTAENTIACVGVCRDEITRPLVKKIDQRWGEAFNFSSLAGMLFLGKTGFKAAQHHAPIYEGRERYVYFAFPHLAIGAGGEIGVCYRPGRSGSSSACGALVGFQKELASGALSVELDNDDIEQSLLKQKLLRRILFGQVPDLTDLTWLAYETILADLERMVKLTTDPAHSDYALLAGIQIHGPEGCNEIWPGEMYASVSGKRTVITLPKRVKSTGG